MGRIQQQVFDSSLIGMLTVIKVNGSLAMTRNNDRRSGVSELKGECIQMTSASRLVSGVFGSSNQRPLFYMIELLVFACMANRDVIVSNEAIKTAVGGLSCTYCRRMTTRQTDLHNSLDRRTPETSGWMHCWWRSKTFRQLQRHLQISCIRRKISQIFSIDPHNGITNTCMRRELRHSLTASFEIVQANGGIAARVIKGVWTRFVSSIMYCCQRNSDSEK